MEEIQDPVVQDLGNIDNDTPMQGEDEVDAPGAENADSEKPEAEKEASTQILNVREKKAVCEFKEQNPSATLKRLVEYVQETFQKKTTNSSVRRLLMRKEEYLSAENANELSKRIRRAKHPELEEELTRWYEENIANGNKLTTEAIKTKASETAKNFGLSEQEFAASNGWVSRFKQRTGQGQTLKTAQKAEQILPSQNAEQIENAEGRAQEASGARNAFKAAEIQLAKSLQRLNSLKANSTITPASKRLEGLAGPSQNQKAAQGNPVMGSYMRSLQDMPRANPPQPSPSGVTVQEAMRSSQILAKYVEAHPELFDTQFQLAFQRNVTHIVTQMLSASTS